MDKRHAKDPGEIARAVDILHEHHIFVHGNFIIGLPGETASTVEQTLNGIARVGFDSVGGGPFYLTPGSTFERRPGKFGIRILDPDWRIRQHVNFYNPDHEYFATRTLTQAEMTELTAVFRRRVEEARLGCWNLSDYALMCWLSAGGTTSGLTTLWQRPAAQLNPTEELVVGVLKEKSGIDLAGSARTLTAATRQLAAAPTSAGRQ